MEKVFSSQQQAKKLLEKELSEIEARQRQSEVRRMKQIRDLGVDLSKIQATSRDLDEVIYDLSPRHREQRRGSLPPLRDATGASHFLDKPRSPRSKRRLSCIAAISPTGPGHTEFPNSLSFRRGNAEMQKHSQLPPIPTERTGSSSTSSSSEECRENSGETFDPELSKLSGKTQGKHRQGCESLEANVFRLGKRRGSVKLNESSSDENVDNNAVDVNQNSEGGNNNDPCPSPTDNISDSELKFHFLDDKRHNRRSSEPELRSIFIRGMHDMSLSDVPSFLYPGGEESEKLRKSIRRNLPSDIVAETDEDETEIDSNRNRITNADIDRSSVTQPRAKLTSISESDQDGELNNDLTIQNCEAGCKEGLETVNDIHRFRDKKSFKLARHRRKSDGDVLVFDSTRRFSRDDRYQPGKSNKMGGFVPSTFSRMRYNCPNNSQVRRDIWQDMKDCRYLRGYDPPEMNEPDEVVKFVFGHRNKD